MYTIGKEGWGADYNDAMSFLELFITGSPYNDVYYSNPEYDALLAEANVKVYKTFVGNYMTAIEMAGCSLTLMKLDDELKALLDAPADTPALKVL